LPGPTSLAAGGALVRRSALPLLLSVFAASAIGSLVRESATFDETAHLPAGYTYLDRWDFRHNPEHPPLAKMWAALPAWLLGLGEPDYESAGWVGIHAPSSDPLRSRANQWEFGYEFLYGKRGDPSRRNPQRVLLPARLAMVGLGVLLCLVVYGWAHETWGPAGARIALFVCCLSPAILAHARYVTTDLPAALGFAATLWCARRWMARPTPGRALATGLSLGAALLFKYTALLLVPTLAGLGLIWAASAGSMAAAAARLRQGIAAGLLGAGVAWGCLWAGYGFRYRAVSDPGYRLEWEILDPQAGPASRAIAWAREGKLLPEAYLFGLAYARSASRYRLAFLNGELSVTGWWFYFPEAFLLKTPLAFLALVGWVAAEGLLRTRGRSFEGWFLAFPIAVYSAASLTASLNIGHRHLLPLYPILCVAAGGLPARGSPWRRAAGAVLLAGCGISFLLASPGYLAYFNFLAGGKRGGWRYLVDSNVDWGQDLPQLRRWMERNAVREVHLAYFGTADPLAYGVRYRKVVLVHDFEPGATQSLPGSGDLFAASVTLLQGVYVDRDEPFAREAVRRGRLSADSVRRWAAERDRLPPSRRLSFRLADWAVKEGLLNEAERKEIEARLLPAFLDRVRETLAPIGRAGDSILIYRIP